MVQAILEENRDKRLYPAKELINIAEQAGFPADQLEIWRSEFIEDGSPESCRECFKRVCHECRENIGSGDRKHRSKKHPKKRWKNARKRLKALRKCWVKKKKDCRKVCRKERKAKPKAGPPRKKHHKKFPKKNLRQMQKTPFRFGRSKKEDGDEESFKRGRNLLRGLRKQVLKWIGW
jgi:hypothetical protein